MQVDKKPGKLTESDGFLHPASDRSYEIQRLSDAEIPFNLARFVAEADHFTGLAGGADLFTPVGEFIGEGITLGSDFVRGAACEQRHCDQCRDADWGRPKAIGAV